MSSPELSVVCKSCGAEVSPYVTECPYCGTRLRKRAPKLERRGDELTPRQRRRRRLRPRAPRLSLTDDRPYATIILILGPAALVLVQRALDQPLVDLGAIVGPVGSEWWRYLASPFVYEDLGYLFVVAIAVALFGAAIERRVGTIATLLLALACGALGMLAADGIETALADEANILIAVGGNGIALGLLGAWAVMRAFEPRSDYDDEGEVIGAAVAAAVLILLPFLEDTANVFAGLAGGAVGGASGLVTALARRRSGAPRE